MKGLSNTVVSPFFTVHPPLLYNLCFFFHY